MRRFISILFALVLVLSFSLLPAVPAAAQTTLEVTLVATHAGIAEWSCAQQHSGSSSVKMKAPDKCDWNDWAGTYADAIIQIPLAGTTLEGLTLNEIDTMSWWNYLISGYPPALRIKLDVDGDGSSDYHLVGEFAYQEWLGPGYVYVGPWNPYTHYKPGLEATNTFYYPTYDTWMQTFHTTNTAGADPAGARPADTVTTTVHSDTIFWTVVVGGTYGVDWHSAPYANLPSYFATLNDYKTSAVSNLNSTGTLPILGDAEVLMLEFAITNEIGLTGAPAGHEVYFDDITINGETYPLELPAARPLTVDDDRAQNPDAYFQTIQGAIDCASAGDTINVAAGEYDAFHIVERVDLSIIGEDGVVILTGEVPPGEDEGACMAWVEGSTGIIIEWLEFDGTGIEDDMVGGVVYIGSTGSITGVTVSHIHGISFGLGIVVSDVGAVVTIEGCNVNDVVGGIFSAGVAVSDGAVASMEDCNIHNCWMEESPDVFGGIGVLVNMDPEMAPATLMMTGCGIFDNNFGIFVNTGGDLTANFNNITGNDVWGICAVEDAVNVDATHNWWGDASGPTHADNPGGSGDAVSDNVDYNPWAGAAIEEAKSETISGSGTMTNSLTGGDVTIDATGDHTITTAKYESNPGGTPTFQSSGNYYDVHLDNVTNVNSLTIKFCPATPSTVIYFWNGTSWVAASNQVYAGGCVTVTITATTTPNLADLTGSVFGGGAPLAGGVVVFLPAISNLTITPTGVRIGEAVTITAEVENKGDDSGSYTVTLKINEVVEEKKTVVLAAHEKKTVTFIVIKDEVGTYEVQVNGLKGEFIVSESLPPASATFEVTDLSISPAKVKVGETVTISVLVAETGGGSGNDNVTLKINGAVMGKQEVALGPQQSQTVTFTIANQEAGSYKVEVNGLAGEFIVEEPPPEAPSPPASAPPAKPINWWLIGGIIAAVVVVGSFTFILVRRRAY